MRSVFIASAAFAVLAAGTFTASAQGSMGQNEKYCATMKGTQTGGAMRCSYKTMAQCEAAVKGGQGTCSENPKMKKM